MDIVKNINGSISEKESKYGKFFVSFSVLWLFGIGLFIRVYGLSEYFFSPDDLMHLAIAENDTLFRVYKYSLSQLHPPLIFFILHYMLQISGSEIFLRCISIIPGAFTIIIFYYIGRNSSGPIAGIIMSYFAAFSYICVIMSQVIRQYSFMLFFLSISLAFIVYYFKNGETKYLAGYLISILVSLSIHYSAFIAFSSISIVLLLSAIFNRKPLKHYIYLFIYHVPHCALLLIFYFFHLKRVSESGFYEAQKTSYLATHFPTTIIELMTDLISFYKAYTWESNSDWVIAFALAGILVLWKKYSKEISGIVIVTFIITFAFAIFKFYPFGDVRHSMYLMPFAALPTAVFFQYIYDIISRRPESNSFFKLHAWFSKYKTAMGLSFTVLIVISSILFVVDLKNIDYFRRYKSESYMEFPLKKENYLKIINAWKTGYSENDILFSNHQTFFYFLYLSEKKQPDLKYLTRDLTMMNYPESNINIYFTRTFGFENGEQIKRALLDLRNRVVLKPDSRIWFMNIGWGSMEDIINQNPLFHEAVENKVIVQAGYIYVVNAAKLYSNIDK